MFEEIELTDREQLILQAVVHTYITTAQPVGSRSVVKRYDLRLSPATVRNVMADLEDSGFLQQLHTSSGRVPTDRGYRYYVDYLMGVQELTLGERNRIEMELSQRIEDADEILRQTCHLLALVTHHTGIVEAPGDENAQLRQIELAPLSPSRLAIMLADNYGRVRTALVTPRAALPKERLSSLSQFLNDHLRGTPMSEVPSRLQARANTLLDEQRGLAEQALELLGAVPIHRPGQLFLEGATQLFEQPEFQDVSRARAVFCLLDEQERLLDLLRRGVAHGDPRRTRVLIGSETAGDGLEEISLVASPYCVKDRLAGVLGVLGPRRMPYPKLTAIVEYTAGMVGRFLTRLAG